MKFKSCYALLFLTLICTAFAADRVTGANSTLDIVAGAKSAALGGTVLSQNDDVLALDLNSYQLSDVQYVWGGFSHVSYYEGTVYDKVSMTLPFGNTHGLGVSFARFGADDIPWIKEGDAIPEGSDYNTLSIADYVFSVSYGRRIFKNFDMGVSLHGLYRKLDQTGLGFRGDATCRYLFFKRISIAMLLKGWTSSSSKWESGEYEYESPEAYLAASWGVSVPYFYGDLNLFWQSAGVFHHEARDLDWDGSERGGRFIDSPLDWLSGGRLGAEFAFDFGLSLRAGLSSLTTFESVTLGAGLSLAKFIRIDYAFESHPVLSAVHRVSVCVSPWLFFKPEREKQRKLYDVSTTLSAEPNEVTTEKSIKDEESLDKNESTVPHNTTKDSESLEYGESYLEWEE